MRIYYTDRQLHYEAGIDTTEKAAGIAKSLTLQPIRDVEILEPAAWPDTLIESVHDAEYVRALRCGEPYFLADCNGLGAWSEGLAQSRFASTSCVVSAAVAAFQTRGVTGTLASGLHHARRSYGAGFCTINGLAVAARAAIDAGAKRVLIVDLDAHCGGGTASFLEALSQVRDGSVVQQLDVSVDSFDWYQNTSYAELHMTSGDQYLNVVEQALDGIVDVGSIDMVLYNAGMDPFEGCGIGGVAGVTKDVLRDRENVVFSMFAKARVPVCFTLAGGYKGVGVSEEELVELHRLTIEAAATSV